MQMWQLKRMCLVAAFFILGLIISHIARGGQTEIAAAAEKPVAPVFVSKQMLSQMHYLVQIETESTLFTRTCVMVITDSGIGISLPACYSEVQEIILSDAVRIEPHTLVYSAILDLKFRTDALCIITVIDQVNGESSIDCALSV